LSIISILLIVGMATTMILGSRSADRTRRLRETARRAPTPTLDEAFDAEWRREHERTSELQKLSWRELRAKCEWAYKHPCECATKNEIAKRIYFFEQHPLHERPQALPAHEATAEVPK